MISRNFIIPEISGKNFTFRKFPGLQNVPRKWQNVTKTCLKTLLMIETKGLHLELVSNFSIFDPNGR